MMVNVTGPLNAKSDSGPGSTLEEVPHTEDGPLSEIQADT